MGVRAVTSMGVRFRWEPESTFILFFVPLRPDGETLVWDLERRNRLHELNAHARSPFGLDGRSNASIFLRASSRLGREAD